MTYQEKLTLPQWQLKRVEILKRDENKCVNCGFRWRPILFSIPLTELILDFEIQIYNIKDKVVYFNKVAKDDGEFSIKLMDKFEKYNPKFFEEYFAFDGFFCLGGFELILDSALCDLTNFDTLWVAFSSFGIDGSITRKRIIHSYIATIFESKNYPELLNYKGKNQTLHVHHKKYIKGKMPWEYEDSDLISLCNLCHSNLHSTQTIPIYNNQGQRIDNAEICNKCNGSGYLEQYHYFQGGVCFKCFGEGVDLIPLLD
jgi:5-methylcytosine-specific restriction endonuclease McrA